MDIESNLIIAEIDTAIYLEGIWRDIENCALH